MVFTCSIVARELSQYEMELEESTYQAEAKEEYGELVSKPLNAASPGRAGARAHSPGNNGSFNINAEEEK